MTTAAASHGNSTPQGWRWRGNGHSLAFLMVQRLWLLEEGWLCLYCAPASGDRVEQGELPGAGTGARSIHHRVENKSIGNDEIELLDNESLKHNVLARKKSQVAVGMLVHLATHPSVHPSFHPLSMYLSVFLPIIHPSFHLSINNPCIDTTIIHVPVHPYI